MRRLRLPELRFGMRPDDWWVGRIEGIIEMEPGTRRTLLLQRTVRELRTETHVHIREAMCERCVCRVEHKEGCQCSREIE